MSTHQTVESDMTSIERTESSVYVPQADWPAVTAMIEGFGDPSLPPSQKLDGTEFEAKYDNETTVTHAFHDGQMTWSSGAANAGGDGAFSYRAVEVRPEIFYVDVIKGEGTSSRCVTMIINRNDGRITIADSCFVDDDGKVRMKTDFLSGRVSSMGEIEPRLESNELVGKRIFYRYSTKEHYEHIYLNQGTFVWHCIRGGEVGLGDVDPINVFELADGVVLLNWSESVMPVESFVVIDLANERSIGRMFCWDGPTLAPLHLPFDSKFTVLNETRYPAA